MEPFATIEDVVRLWREMDSNEIERAEALLEVVSNELRYRAKRVGKNLDEMIERIPELKSVAISVTVDVVARCLMTSTNAEPTTQFSQSALGYSVSGTYLVPGGGLFIKKSELARLGLRGQSIGFIEMYDYSYQGNNGCSHQ